MPNIICSVCQPYLFVQIKIFCWAKKTNRLKRILHYSNLGHNSGSVRFKKQKVHFAFHNSNFVATVTVPIIHEQVIKLVNCHKLLPSRGSSTNLDHSLSCYASSCSQMNIELPVCYITEHLQDTL